jgi:putative pyruvate formate lyase activating enzyme
MLNLNHCHLCPRQCGADRTSGQLGYCKSGVKPLVSSVCIHHGEEPVISGKKGICNVFFAHCNLHCVYCQNHQISRNDGSTTEYEYDTERLAQEIINVMEEKPLLQEKGRGERLLGFVSPAHFSLQMVEVIEKLHSQGYKPTIIYNTNGYEAPDVLEYLADYVDVYLPDFKYSDNALAADFSDVSDYVEKTSEALKIMYRQKGAELTLDNHGLARNGIIIRHLVLPGHVENSKGVLRTIAKIAPNIHISLMSQYYPPYRLPIPELNRPLHNSEYETITQEMETLGLENGWIQELESSENYRPDFEKKHPFGG